MPQTTIGQPVLRKEGVAKVTGAARYVDDVRPSNLLHGVTVRSSVPRGIIKGIRFEGDLPWDEIVVVTADDIPGHNHVTLLDTDQPFLASGEVHHAEEPILLLGHEDKYLLEKARRHVKVDIDPLPAIFTIDEALDKQCVIWGDDNVFKRFLVEKGDVEAVFAQPGVHIIEGEYSTGAQEQLYIETNGMIAQANPQDGVTVWGSLQCPYYVHKALLPLFDLPPEKVRVVQTETGGGFGGKEEYPNILAGHAALLSWKAGRPVKMIYDRAEDMAATTKRHPSYTKHRTAVAADGKILAMDIEFYLDGGAYMTLSPVVLSRGTIHAAGPYNVDNVRIHAAALATNLPPHGAFRGFGAPQSIFALERHMDRIATSLKLEPAELRRRNFLHKGHTTATGQEIHENVDLSGLLETAFNESDYHRKRQEFAKQSPNAAVRRGIGFATFMHGAGFTGSGEKNLRSVAAVEATADKVRVLAASTEIGQGTQTIFSQIVADALGLAYEDVEVAQPDTSHVPNSGPTVASRTCMVVGKLVESAALGIKQSLLQTGVLAERYTRDEFFAACRQYLDQHGALKIFSEYKQPEHINWDDKTYRGDAYATYAWAVYVAEVSVDTRTYETRVEDFVAVQEVGKVIHPVLAAGQIEGGVAQAIGFGIYEKVEWQNGSMANNRMTNYIMPTSVDLPPIRVFFAESKNAFGPAGGAKGIGELPMDGGAPAILSAVQQAVGVFPTRAPMLPEDLMQLMEA